MRHQIWPSAAPDGMAVEYGWQRRGAWEHLSARVSGAPSTPGDETEETFITEHYWGYSRQRDGSAIEYQVEHPRWRVWRAEEASLECEVSTLYGPEFSDSLSGPPSTAFVAEGARTVVIRAGHHLG